MSSTEVERYRAFREGVEMWTAGEVFTAPGGEVVEILYTQKVGGEKMFFAELPGKPACAHGETVEDAIQDAREKRGEVEPLTDDEKEKYRAENYKFSVRLFIRLTKACRAGAKAWLAARDLPLSTQMTLKEFREAGGGQWADALEKSIQ